MQRGRLAAGLGTGAVMTVTCSRQKARRRRMFHRLQRRQTAGRLLVPRGQRPLVIRATQRQKMTRQAASPCLSRSADPKSSPRGVLPAALSLARKLQAKALRKRLTQQSVRKQQGTRCHRIQLARLRMLVSLPARAGMMVMRTAARAPQSPTQPRLWMPRPRLRMLLGRVRHATSYPKRATTPRSKCASTETLTVTL